MQSVSSRIWTRVAMFISYDDNNYTTGTSIFILSKFLIAQSAGAVEYINCIS